MASVVLRSVGGAVGNALLPGIGGVFGSVIGGSLGSAIDGQLGLGPHVTGPRLENLSVQDSRYGASIPIVYGSARIAGNVIWSTDLIETEHDSTTSGGGKGGLGGGGSVTTTTFTYSVHCAIGICAGPIGAIDTIWADSKIIYQNGTWASGTVDSASIYLGDTSQGPDSFMESIIGTGDVPGNRGLAYVVLENFQLANFGNRIPNITFQVLPVPANANPEWLGSVDALIDVPTHTFEFGAMMPIPLGGSTIETGRVLIGGCVNPGPNTAFEVVSYDVTGDTPLELSRIQSGTFATGGVLDMTWALAPDGRYIAMSLQNNTTVTERLVIYDTETETFGAVLGVNMTLGFSSTKQIAWIDPQHFIMDDVSGTHRGLHVFARAGMNIIDLGFWDVWGSGTALNYTNFFYGQFTPYGSGFLNYVWDVSIPLFITLYARPISWQNNALVVGPAYTVVSSLPTGTGAGLFGGMIPTGGDEYTIFFGDAIDTRFISFVPGGTSATVTRPWQIFAPSFGTQLSAFPIYYGDRLVLIQCGSLDVHYRLSEIMLNSGSFSLGLNGVFVNNSFSGAEGYCGLAIDISKFLFIGSGGFVSDTQQFGIIQRCDTGSGLDDILADILNRAGYVSGDYDVTAVSHISVDGYVLQDATSARAAIQPLQVFTPFDLVESNGKLVAVPRSGTANITIDSSEWRAVAEKGEPPPALDIVRAQEMDLPLEVDVDYIDEARNFEVNSQRARRTASKALTVQKIALPIVCTSDTAKQIAETRLFTMWAERELVRLSISRRYVSVDPGDVIDLGTGDLLRVTRVHQSGGLLQVEGFYVFAAALGSVAAADIGQMVSSSVVDPLDTSLYLMDLPLLQSTDDQPGVYAAASGLPGWTGANLWRSSDGVNYSNITTLTSTAVTGIAITTPANVSALYMDNMSAVEVQVMNGSLSSCNVNDLYNGANAALLGNEIIQFQTATLIGPGLYTLTNLLRGRRGTESAVGSHTVGENFVMLVSGPVKFVPALLTDRNASYDFRALTKGQSLNDASDSVFKYNLNTIRPFSPVNLAGSRASGTGSDLTLTWVRRARLNAEWVDYVDVPLDEPSELYDLEIMNGSSVMRTFSSLTSPTATYTAAQQSSDWGTVPGTFTVNVYQLSSRYGRGLA
ncbi:MAG TPA: phage tail protein, partial [Alphaproteobacteria bacterium]|nr:phage tail protein [Alphaproteobacteria bacterium]